MPIEYETAPVETLANNLSGVLTMVVSQMRRVFVTYKGIPMAVVVPMHEVAFLEDADRRIFEMMAAQADAAEPPADRFR